GYKLKALLAYRQQMPDGARWLMFGDDAESDADIFVLFGQICSGLRGASLQTRLIASAVHIKDQAEILQLCEQIPIGPDPVELIGIRQVRRRPVIDDPRIIVASSYLTTALVVAHRGHIRPQAVINIAHALRRRGVTDAGLAAAVDQAKKRFGVSDELLKLADRR
ncbi:MAG: hypothetical protein AAF449_20015, partial [Myxococcota bacterium]